MSENENRFFAGFRQYRRDISFAAVMVILLAVFAPLLKALFQLSLRNDLYSHIFFGPIVSLFFMYRERKTIFSAPAYAPAEALFLTSAGGVLYGMGIVIKESLSPNGMLALQMLSAIVAFSGIFVFFYGTVACRKAAFSLLFLLVMVPMPDSLEKVVVHLLQRGSAEAANFLFQWTGLPVVRDGFFFHLPGLSIEVAEECSGIRSGMALFITSVIGGRLFLRRGWMKVVLSLSTIPVSIFKNGVRIVTLSLLNVYVDNRILESSLHKRGGVVFLIPALLVLGSIMLWLRRMEKP